MKSNRWSRVKGGVTAAKGFKAAGVRCGLKTKGEDFALIYTDTPATAAAVFTKNKVQAAPIAVCRQHLKRGPIRAIAVNSGCANACTGTQGEANARSMAELTASALGIPANQVLIASTGVIGDPLNMDKIRLGITEAQAQLSRSGSDAASRAIMTTDLVPKTAARRFKIGKSTISISLGGMTKGSGMIHPNMATMLAFLTTDLAIDTRCLRKALLSAVKDTFNMITVDGDTSTNDSVMLLANGAAGNLPIKDPESAEYHQFVAVLTDLCQDLAVQIVRDGEGATKLVRIEVSEAKNTREAQLVAKSIAGSNLVKTAIFGEDPNWGRILCAAGYSKANINPERFQLWIGRYQVVKNGQPRADYNEKTAAQQMQKKEILIRVKLGLGEAEATAWTCDFSYEYVKINAEYHT